MSTARGAKLKAQYNRVRTSTALRANDMWTNTIGMEANPQAGSNAAIEAAIYAPTHGGGGAGGRAQRRELAQQLIQATGYQPSVTDYESLLTLAKAQGTLGAGTRGACKLCGGMGHLTKQCTNFITGHNAAGTDVVVPAGGAAAEASMGLLPDPDQLGISDLSSSSSDTDSNAGSSSDSGSSDSERERRRNKKRKREKKDKKSRKEKRDKKERRDHKHKKSKSSSKTKSKKRRRETRTD